MKKGNVITISDVAEALGVSKTTVSRAISGKGRIGEATRQKVLAYIEEHDYKPNVIARGLAQSKTFNLCVVMPEDYALVDLPFFQEVITGEMVARGKPSPEIYQLACKKLGLRPEDALALEDSYNGIRSACEAGTKVVMIPDILTEDAPVRECLYGKMESLESVAKWIAGDIFICDKR